MSSNETDQPTQTMKTLLTAFNLPVLFLALVMACGTNVHAQSTESDAAPARGKLEAEVLAPPVQPYVVPDLLPETLATLTQFKTSWFTFKAGFVAIADYTSFGQDANSLSQVGRQRDQWDDRAARVMFNGTIGQDYKIGYLFAAEYNGFDSDKTDTWSITDASLAFPLGSPATKLTIGKTKETFAYEMVGDAANLPQQERILSPFFVSRNIGIKLSHVFGENQWMTASVGVFNDWLAGDNSFRDNGTDITARVTGLVWDKNEGRSFLHLGASGRYVGAEKGTMRYAARPESNVADNYLDTGSIVGDHAMHLGLEALWNEGPFSLLAEYNHAWVSSAQSGDPGFSGCYITGSWVLTGETRPYDRTVGYARRVIPQSRWGALELVVRYSSEDLNGGTVKGGSFDKTYVGINWWATRRAKVGFGWGHTLLDRFEKTGVTDSFQTRLQWVY